VNHRPVLPLSFALLGLLFVGATCLGLRMAAGPPRAGRAGAVPTEGVPDEQFRALARRIRAKQAAAADLIERRLTPLEAVALFRDLNRWAPDLSRCYRTAFPDQTEEEIACRQVLNYVRKELEATSPERAAAEVARLEAELEEHRARHGGAVRLPGR
jgi:hypothetical protein